MAVAAYAYLEDKEALIGRLHRIEGQVRGIERMVSEERYCIDILTQISAATTALDAMALKCWKAKWARVSPVHWHQATRQRRPKSARS